MQLTSLFWLSFALQLISTTPLLPGLELLCQTQSQPNPIAAQYPSLATGTINGTVIVLPIDLALARSLIPSQYRILSGYKDLAPGLPAGKYPLIAEAVLDHGVQSSGLAIPDFSRIAFSFPFVDLLGDGYSNFRYEKYLYLTANAVAIAGSSLYGEIPITSTFDPPCDGYAYTPNGNGEIFFNAYQGLDQTLGLPPAAALKFKPTGGVSTGPYSVDFYKNVTNQPSFSNGLTCDNFISLFNSSVSQGQYAPVAIQGSFTVSSPILPTATTFTNVYGLKIDRAFIENNYKACSSLKGYSGTGSGD